MRLAIAAIGRMRSSPEAQLVEDYLKRCNDIGRRIGLSGPALAEFEPPRGLAGAKRTQKEGEWLLAAADDALIFALDEGGDNLSSEAVAGLIGEARDSGAKSAAFLIGGADGHAPAIRKSARRTIAFGRATWPHMLVRAMLAEQIYRAMTILDGHPYHRQ